MKIFAKPNLNDRKWVCPICRKNTEKQITLIPINGTQNGSIIRAEQVHVDCLDFTLFMMGGKQAIAMFLNQEENFKIDFEEVPD